LDDETKQQVTKNVVNILKPCNQVNTRSYSLHRSILVSKDNDKMIRNVNVMNPPLSTPSNKTNATATAALQHIDIGNDKEIDVEKEKEKEGKNCTVKVCMDSDVEIIGKAFVSDMMGVDIQQNVHDETVKPNKKIPKKPTRKLGKVDESNDKLLMKVHRVMWVATPHDTNNSKQSVSTAMSKKIFKWSQGLFCKCFGTTQHIHQFEIFSNFLYDTVQEDGIDYPSRLTWIDNVICGDDDDLYAIRLLFVLTCSKCVRDATL